MASGKEAYNKADYERFIDLMTHMYLKYGINRIVTAKMVIELFPKHQCGKGREKQKRA